MYIPPHFRQHNQEAAISFMKRYPFAVVVSNGTDAPVATHLPFHISVAGEQIVLTAHFAKANPQWKSLDNLLVIFSGPHSYISPGNYEKEENVPTWNYIAVHAYGKAELVTDTKEGLAILEEMMQQSEPEYLAQWERLNEDYKRRLYNGIVPFRVHVTRIDAKEKLSQNKTKTERTNIIDWLSKSEDGAAQQIGVLMAEKESNS
jgi:transcriptional regulator